MHQHSRGFLRTLSVGAAALLALALSPLTAFAEGWSLSISSVGTAESPYVTETALSGYSVGTITYTNTAGSGSCFALVTVVATQAGVDSLDVSSARLVVDGTSYAPVTSVDKLTKSSSGTTEELLDPVAIPALAGFHNLPSFGGASSDLLTTTSRGTLVFEVPSSYKGSDGAGWVVTCEGASDSAAFDPADKSIDAQDSLVASQRKRDAAMAAAYEADPRTIDDPMVFVNPYGRAPLTALAMFDTASEDTASVVVHGRTSDCDVSYEVSGSSTHHEVPIYGLYPGVDNSVTITSGGSSKTISVRTDALPSGMESVERVAGSGSGQQVGQLYVCQSPHTIAFDNQGDIRWYVTDLATDSAYGFQLTDGDSKITYFRNELNNNVFTSVGDELVQMDWLGKVDTLVSSPGLQDDHDSCVVDDDTVLYISAGMSNDARIMRLDLATGETTPWLVMSDVLDPGVDPSYPTWDDLWHLNTVRYYKDAEHGDYVLVSARNQSLVMKVRWTGSAVTADDVEWALTPTCTRDDAGQQEALKGKYVRPADPDDGFEWFFDQHDCNMVSYDGSTMRVALFDNGIVRNNVGDPVNPDQYSRGVVYSIDEGSMTVTQEYSFGKGIPEERDLYSVVRGSCRVLGPERDAHVVACFPIYKDSWNASTVVETDAANGVIAEYRYSSDTCGLYRTQVVDPAGSGMFSNYSVADNAGRELHRYERSYWTSTSFSPGDGFSEVSASVTRDEDSVTCEGTARVGGGSPTSAMEVVAVSDEGAAYSFSVPVLEDGKLYAKCVPTQSLPDGRYHLYLRGTAADGTVATYDFDKVLRVGAASTAGVSVVSETGDDSQEQVLEGLLSAAMDHGLDDLEIKPDPFGASPLTAVALFRTEDVCSVHMTVHGKDGADDVSYDVSDAGVLHVVPIVGLYADDTTSVTVSVTHEDGTSEEVTRDVSTGGAPDGAVLPSVSVTRADGVADSDLAPGLTFCAPVGNCYYAVDHAGAIRWYLSKTTSHGVAGVSFTSDGHLLMVDKGDTSSASTNGYVVREVDLLGREYRHLVVRDASVHHEVKELSNGDILLGVTDLTKGTINDGFVIVDGTTGEEKYRCNFDEVLCDKYGVPKTQDAVWGVPHETDADGNEYDTNWLHNNAVFYQDMGTPETDDDYVVFSSRHRSIVAKMEVASQQVDWVIGDHAGLEGTGLADKLLTPADGLEWQYAQHAPMVMENGDILVFDNGVHRTKDSSVSPEVPATENYSRLVEYHVDEGARTVTQVREFGKDDADWSLVDGDGANDHYCTYIGDADELSNGSWLGAFGGHVIDSGGAVSDQIMAAYAGGRNTATLVEVDPSGRLLWQLDATPDSGSVSGIYRSERKQLTSLDGYYDASGSMWVGDAGGEAKRAELDLSGYAEGAVGVSGDVTVTDYGQRLTVSGLLEDAEATKGVYVVCDGTPYVATVTGRSFSASFGIPNDRIHDDHTLSLAATCDGEKTVEALDADVPGTGTFSLAAYGTDLVDEGEAIEVGGSSQLHVLGSPCLASRDLSFESSDESVASVDGGGLVRALRPGISLVTATDDTTGLRSQVLVTVTGRALDKASLSMRVGDKADLSLVGLGAPVAPGEVAWASSDNSVATASTDGTVTAVSPGDATIAVFVNGTQYPCQVHVVPAIDDGVYTIASRLGGNLVLDVAAGSASDGANVQVWSNNQSPAQLFRVTYAGGGLYQLSPLCSDKVLDVAGGSYESGANLQQYEGNGTKAQLWDIVDNGDGSYTFVSALSGKVVDVAGAGTRNGTNVQLWDSNGSDAQRFALERYFSPGVYAISPAAMGDVSLDVEGAGGWDGANVQLYGTNRSYAQLFCFRYERDGAYSVMALCSGKYLDVAGGSGSDGANVQQWAWNGSDAQLWYVERVGDDSFRLVNKGSGKALDVAGGLLRPGSNVQQWEANGTAAQTLRLTSASSVATISPATAQGYALDVSGASAAPGANVQLYARNGTNAQRFFVTRVAADGTRAIISTLANNALDAAADGRDPGTNVQSYTYNGTAAQHWFVQYVGKRDEASAYRIIGASSRMALDVSGGAFHPGSNVQLWDWNASDAQLWAIAFE